MAQYPWPEALRYGALLQPWDLPPALIRMCEELSRFSDWIHHFVPLLEHLREFNLTGMIAGYEELLNRNNHPGSDACPNPWNSA